MLVVVVMVVAVIMVVIVSMIVSMIVVMIVITGFTVCMIVSTAWPVHVAFGGIFLGE